LEHIELLRSVQKIRF